MIMQNLSPLKVLKLIKSLGIKLITEIQSFYLQNSQLEDKIEEKDPFNVRAKQRKYL